MRRRAGLVAGLVAAAAMWGCDSLLTPSLYGSVQVTVVRRDGTPIPNVPLTVYYIQRRLYAGTTDANGVYTFELVPEGSYGVFSELIPGYARPEQVRPGPRTDFVDNIDVARGATATAQLSMLKVGPGSIVATVSESGGGSLAGIAVTLYRGAEGAVREGVTDGNGRVTFADVPFGDWGVSVTRPSKYLDSAEAPLLVRDGLLVDEGSVEKAEFTFAPCTGTIAARVRDDTNGPVPGARISLYQFGQDVDSAVAPASGDHPFTGLQCRDYGVRLTAAPIGWTLVPGRGFNFVDGLFVHRGATRTADLRVQRVACRGTLRVTVVDNNGSAVGGAGLLLYTGGVAYRNSVTPANGIVSFADLPCDRDWGVSVTPPATHSVPAASSYFDGIVFTNGQTINRTFTLTALAPQ